MLCIARPYTGPITSAGLRVPELLLSRFCRLCIFAGKMLTLLTSLCVHLISAV